MRCGNWRRARRESSCWQGASCSAGSLVSQPGCLGCLAGKESSQVGWLVVAAGEERFGTAVGVLCRSAGNRPVLWMDRWPEKRRERAGGVTEISSAIGDEHLVQDQSQ